MDCRIDATLEDMASTALVDLPEERPITCEEFLDKTEKTVALSGERFVTGSDFVERAVFEIIDVSTLILSESLPLSLSLSLSSILSFFLFYFRQECYHFTVERLLGAQPCLSFSLVD